jgi:hypothetical protein
LAALVLFLYSYSPYTYAVSVHFRTDIDDTVLLPGEQAVISVSAMVEDGTEDNGIVSWGLDLMLDDPSEDNVVTYASDAYFPIGHYLTEGLSTMVNTPVQGAAQFIGTESKGGTSNLGISGYELVLQVTVTALEVTEETTVSYELGSYYEPSEFWAGLADGQTLNASFDLTSVTDITVLPEPTTAVLLMVSAIALRYRRK